jgi:hypothetical protein
MSEVIERPATGGEHTRKHGNERHTEAYAGETAIAAAVEAYLLAHPPTGGLTIEQIKADTDITAAITQMHGHTNKTILDGIDTAFMAAVTAAYNHSVEDHAPSNAEQNVNADWNASSGDAQILNKPALSVPTNWGKYF